MSSIATTFLSVFVEKVQSIIIVTRNDTEWEHIGDIDQNSISTRIDTTSTFESDSTRIISILSTITTQVSISIVWGRWGI